MIKEYYETREQWLAIRDSHSRDKLGGSDMGAILGMSAWASPYSVWARRIGRIAPVQDNEAMRQGRDLEDYVARRFTEATGKGVHRVNAVLTSDEHPFLLATIDRKVSNEDAGLECKTCSALASRKFSGGNFPENYYAQCVTYLAVSGLRTWYLAALVLGQGLHIYVVTRDAGAVKPEWAEGILYVSDGEVEAVDRAASDFVGKYLDPASSLSETGPDPDGASATTDAIREIYGGAADASATVDLDPVEDALKSREELKKTEADVKRQIAEAEQSVMIMLGSCEHGKCEGFKVTWKNHDRRTLDADAVKDALGGEIPDGLYKTSTSRVLRIRAN